MSKGRLTIETGDEPITFDFDVRDDADKVVIEVLAHDVKIHTKNEPKVVPQ